MNNHFFVFYRFYIINIINIINTIDKFMTSDPILGLFYFMGLFWIAMMLMQLNRAMMAEDEETPAEIHVLMIV